MKARLILLLTATVTALLALTQAAGAVVHVSHETDHITLNAGGGRQAIFFQTQTATPGEITFRSLAPVTEFAPQGACVQSGTTEAPAVTCPLAGVGRLFVNMGDGDDLLTGGVYAGSSPQLGVVFPVPMRVDGGRGADDLQTAGATSVALGGKGNDRLYARMGDSLMRGGWGNDRLMAPEAGDHDLWGGAHGDILTSGSGDDRLVGGAGRDVMRAGAGDDRVLARDNGRQWRDKQVSCGSGSDDGAILDLLDPRPKGCESVIRKRVR
jgi:hypothetical protein